MPSSIGSRPRRSPKPAPAASRSSPKCSPRAKPSIRSQRSSRNPPVSASTSGSGHLLEHEIEVPVEDVVGPVPVGKALHGLPALQHRGANRLPSQDTAVEGGGELGGGCVSDR